MQRMLLLNILGKDSGECKNNGLRARITGYVTASANLPKLCRDLVLRAVEIRHGSA